MGVLMTHGRLVLQWGPREQVLSTCCAGASGAGPWGHSVQDGTEEVPRNT